MSSILHNVLSSGATAAHSAVASLAAKSQIAPGQNLPDVVTHSVKVKQASSADNAITLTQAFGEGKIVIVGVPGAFTPPCSNQVPKYIENEKEFYAKGVSKIYIVAVNDAFVMNAWKEKLTNGKETNVEFIADDKGELTSALGLLFDASGLLGGPRSKRSVIIAENGSVTHVAVEEEAPSVTVTSAETILAQL